MPRNPSAVTLEQVVGYLARLAPLGLAESWDNVGLLVGDRSVRLSRIITCLTVTPAVVDEAVEEHCGLVVTHHPLPFQPLKRITTDTTTGRMLLRLIAAGVAVYSAHTAFDSADRGINHQLAERLALRATASLQPIESAAANSTEAAAESSLVAAPIGSGRYGALERPESLEQLARRVGRCLPGAKVRAVGDPRAVVGRVGIACGSGGSFLAAARRRSCDALVTGEANFHACLEAEATGLGLILVGHYASERFAMEALAGEIGEAFPGLEVWASRRERDPLWTVEGCG